jgi:hypothetical protein
VFLDVCENSAEKQTDQGSLNVAHFTTMVLPDPFQPGSSPNWRNTQEVSKFDQPRGHLRAILPVWMATHSRPKNEFPKVGLIEFPIRIGLATSGS